MGAVFRWVKYIYEWCKNFGINILGSGAGEIDSLVGLGKGANFYVDGDNGSDDYDGLSWAKAFKTIQKAITTSNALADWTWKKFNTIWVMPGDYPENLDGDILMTHIVGLGIDGTDTMVNICPTTGSVLAKVAADSCNLVGAHLANLRFEVKEAVPILDIEVANNSLIEHCHFYKVGDFSPVGIDTENCTHLTVRYCKFDEGGGPELAYGMYFRGGAGKFLHACRIHDNDIYAERGIFNEATSTKTVIKRNVVVATVGIGIEDAGLGGGAAYIVDNNVYALTDAINTAGGAARTIRNRVQEGAVAAWETA